MPDRPVAQEDARLFLLLHGEDGVIVFVARPHEHVEDVPPRPGEDFAFGLQPAASGEDDEDAVVEGVRVAAAGDVEASSSDSSDCASGFGKSRSST